MTNTNTPTSAGSRAAAGSAPLMGREYVNASTRRRAICVSHEMMGSVVMQNTTAPESGKRWIAEVESIRRNWIESERQTDLLNAAGSATPEVKP